MALHEKLTSLAKDAATKANSLAKDAASKANTAIENGKLSLKINNEEKKIDEFTLNIGELILDQLDGGETFDDEIMALYSSIQAARDVITAARADIEANRQSAGPADENVDDGPTVCESCGMPLTENANYCANCGAKVEPFVEVEEEAQRKWTSASVRPPRKPRQKRPQSKRLRPKTPAAAAARPLKRKNKQEALTA